MRRWVKKFVTVDDNFVFMNRLLGKLMKNWLNIRFEGWVYIWPWLQWYICFEWSKLSFHLDAESILGLYGVIRFTWNAQFKFILSAVICLFVIISSSTLFTVLNIKIVLQRKIKGGGERKSPHSTTWIFLTHLRT